MRITCSGTAFVDSPVRRLKITLQGVKNTRTLLEILIRKVVQIEHLNQTALSITNIGNLLGGRNCKGCSTRLLMPSNCEPSQSYLWEQINIGP